MRTLYLAGPINGCADADCIDWRCAVADALALCYTILDPMRRDYRGREADSAAAIVEGDEADLQACDVVLVNALQGASWGTAMEVRAAFHEYGKRVVVIADQRRPMSPWLRYHSHAQCGSVPHAVNYLLRDARESAATTPRGLRGGR